MVPMRLALKNFMCYRDNVPELDLEGIHVACLSGDNGHGKTALLDAMTWALWGQSRARTQDELIHQGQQDMAVELDFDARGQRYRVSRRHSRSGSASGRQGSSLLELQVASGDGFQPMTGNSIRETEERIREVLHLDYDTFVNTAFLVQGKADQFSRSTPAKRKETLAEVLDLDYYQRLEERAKRRSREVQLDLQDAERFISSARVEIEGRGELQARLETLQGELQAIEPQFAERAARVVELDRALGALQGRRDELADLSGRIATAESEATGYARQVSTHEAKIAEYELTLAQTSRVEEGFARLGQARTSLERLSAAARASNEVAAGVAALEQQVAVQRERLNSRLELIRSTIETDLRPKARQLAALEAGLGKTRAKEEALSALEADIEAKRSGLNNLLAREAYLHESNKALKDEMEETRRKFEMLTEDEAQCPLCKQPLGPDGRDHLANEYETTGRAAKERFRANETEVGDLGLRKFEGTTSISNLENELNSGRRELQASQAQLELDIREARRAAAALDPANDELLALTKQIAEDAFSIEERTRLDKMQEELAAIDYDAEEHQRVEDEARTLVEFDALHRGLDEARRGLPEEQEELATTLQYLKQREQQLTGDRERAANLGQELASFADIEQETIAARAEAEDLRKQREGKQVELGVINQDLTRLGRRQAELAVKEQSVRRLTGDKGVYDELSAAFGKNGIQALIIETAMPQLQEDANELLGRLTENRLVLKLQVEEGRRDNRSGRPSEELQILISDELGTRSYETFSGGEAFRIDFALRIALSKLLARRSGAPLPTLFIDEGFGTQDASGQERLKEVIHSIQDDFEKIIAITHVDQVKESFPVRIEVTKTEMGSTFVVV